jgi:hypothetical protein
LSNAVNFIETKLPVINHIINAFYGDSVTDRKSI